MLIDIITNTCLAAGVYFMQLALLVQLVIILTTASLQAMHAELLTR
jgi:hypothetical protein